MDIAPLLEALLRHDPSTIELESIEAWWRAHLQATADGAGPAHRAVLGGFAADRWAYAFASGYTEAMRHLLGDADARRRALCATELGGGHPRAIECALELDEDGGGRLTGDKSFVSLGDFAQELIVIATTGGDAEGRKRLRVVRLPSGRDGVRVVPLPELAFVPEMPHARVELREVEVHPDELLPGDGYLRVLKPFRTIEDTHVHLAMLGWLVRLGRAHDWDAEVIERTLGLIAQLVPLAATRHPLSPAVHRTLGGSLAAIQDLVEAIEGSEAWRRLPDPVRTGWTRDRRLLEVAAKIRDRRLQAARNAPG